MYSLLRHSPHAAIFVLSVGLFFLLRAFFRKSDEVAQFGFPSPLFETRKVYLLIAIVGVLWVLLHL